MQRKEGLPMTEYYNTGWFLEELENVRRNPVTSGLTSQFNRFLAKVRGGEWTSKEKYTAESLLRIGMTQERISVSLEEIRTEPSKLEPFFVEYMAGLRGKTIEAQEFNQDEQQLASSLVLTGVPEEAVIRIWNDVLSLRRVPEGFASLQAIAEIEIGRAFLEQMAHFSHYDFSKIGPLVDRFKEDLRGELETQGPVPNIDYMIAICLFIRQLRGEGEEFRRVRLSLAAVKAEESRLGGQRDDQSVLTFYRRILRELDTAMEGDNL